MADDRHSAVVPALLGFLHILPSVEWNFLWGEEEVQERACNAWRLSRGPSWTGRSKRRRRLVAAAAAFCSMILLHTLRPSSSLVQAQSEVEAPDPAHSKEEHRRAAAVDSVFKSTTDSDRLADNVVVHSKGGCYGDARWRSRALQRCFWVTLRETRVVLFNYSLADAKAGNNPPPDSTQANTAYQPRECVTSVHELIAFPVNGQLTIGFDPCYSGGEGKQKQRQERRQHNCCCKLQSAAAAASVTISTAEEYTGSGVSGRLAAKRSTRNSPDDYFGPDGGGRFLDPALSAIEILPILFSNSAPPPSNGYQPPSETVTERRTPLSAAFFPEERPPMSPVLSSSFQLQSEAEAMVRASSSANPTQRTQLREDVILLLVHRINCGGAKEVVVDSFDPLGRRWNPDDGVGYRNGCARDHHPSSEAVASPYSPSPSPSPSPSSSSSSAAAAAAAAAACAGIRFQPHNAPRFFTTLSKVSLRHQGTEPPCQPDGQVELDSTPKACSSSAGIASFRRSGRGDQKSPTVRTFSLVPTAVLQTRRVGVTPSQGTGEPASRSRQDGSNIKTSGGTGTDRCNGSSRSSSSSSKTIGGQTGTDRCNGTSSSSSKTSGGGIGTHRCNGTSSSISSGKTSGGGTGTESTDRCNGTTSSSSSGKTSGAGTGTESTDRCNGTSSSSSSSNSSSRPRSGPSNPRSPDRQFPGLADSNNDVQVSLTASQQSESRRSLLYKVKVDSRKDVQVRLIFAELSSEVIDQRSRLSRVFDVLICGELRFSDVDIYEKAQGKFKAVELVVDKCGSCDGKLELELRAKPSSALPPALNAFEIHTRIPGNTRSSDVTALLAVRSSFKLGSDDEDHSRDSDVDHSTSAWSLSDPCRPPAWTGVYCQSSSPPVVSALFLGGRKIAGMIASRISDLKDLQVLDLRENQLSGSIPKSLADLPKFSGNPRLCGAPVLVQCSSEQLTEPLQSEPMATGMRNSMPSSSHHSPLDRQDRAHRDLLITTAAIRANSMERHSTEPFETSKETSLSSSLIRARRVVEEPASSSQLRSEIGQPGKSGLSSADASKIIGDGSHRVLVSSSEPGPWGTKSFPSSSSSSSSRSRSGGPRTRANNSHADQGAANPSVLAHKPSNSSYPSTASTGHDPVREAEPGSTPRPSPMEQRGVGAVSSLSRAHSAQPSIKMGGTMSGSFVKKDHFVYLALASGVGMLIAVFIVCFLGSLYVKRGRRYHRQKEVLMRSWGLPQLRKPSHNAQGCKRDAPENSMEAGDGDMDSMVKRVSSLERTRLHVFSYGELRSITDNFATPIGSGGFGFVFKGTLPCGQEVAVKMHKQHSVQGVDEFCKEVEVLSRLHHRHLVPLIGYCIESGNNALVYELMSNGSLSDHLSGRRKCDGATLTWKQRLTIALGAARAIDYLHTEATPAIIHRDIKSSNILIDESFNARVNDFGLSTLWGDESSSHVTTHVKGTAGYVDPDYYYTRCLSEKSDVYSFGVVLLEVLTGGAHIDFHRDRTAWNIVSWVRPAFELGNVESVLDVRIKMDGRFTSAAVRSFARCALQCCEMSPDTRPSMNDVVQELRQIIKIETEADEASAFITVLDDDRQPSTQRATSSSSTELCRRGSAAYAEQYDVINYDVRCDYIDPIAVNDKDRALESNRLPKVAADEKCRQLDVQTPSHQAPSRTYVVNALDQRGKAAEGDYGEGFSCQDVFQEVDLEGTPSPKTPRIADKCKGKQIHSGSDTTILQGKQQHMQCGGNLSQCLQPCCGEHRSTGMHHVSMAAHI
ncbi:hypothetical protein CBR_g27945 [Chara braunii]|uniref:Protein kinase domain-containing protein n=1 Tax=Chara braunii TaxID=69332 RepID=A0A388L8S4_CHABU|nr:hypothetical protein CBR_g27945 [Chara braunii]|eukprot:GBG78720.1 hypothetical protein CBR_g27945 [Chara braunii]